MRILHVIASVDPREGGPIEGTRLSALAMRELGHETEVVTLDDAGSETRFDFPAPVHPQGRGIGKYRYNGKLASWIAANAHRFDAAVIHGLWNHASIGGWQGLRRSGLPYVILTHGMMDPWFRRRYPLKHVAKQIFWWLWQGRVLRDAYAVLFTCEEERRLAKGVFKAYRYKEQVVAYGSSEPSPLISAEIDIFRRSLPRLGSRKFILFMSRIHPKKGCDVLITAFAEIASEFDDVDLVVAGPDQVGETQKIQQLAQKLGIDKRVHWPGMISGQIKTSALMTTEVLILPSHQENFGIVVAEALSYGRPVIISDRVNIWTEVRDAGAGFVGGDTVAATRENMRRFLTLDRPARAAMSRAAFDLFQRRFTASAAAADLERVLKSAALHRRMNHSEM